MTTAKFSVIIPYKQRLANLGIVLASLADQTLPAEEFEVVVGVMEYAEDYVAMARSFADRLDITSVLSAREWSVSAARNLALRHAAGEVVLVLDADIALPTRFLENLYDRYYAHGQNVCVIGQMVGYDEVVEVDVAEVGAEHNYRTYRDRLAELEKSGEVLLDARWTPEYAAPFARFPWAFARGGLLAITGDTLRRHGLTFDEGFLGWGPEDQEWALRATRTGTPLVLGQGVYGLHLPHHRSQAVNGNTAWRNNRYYLDRWPRLDLEVALAFGGWLTADKMLPAVEKELAAAKARHGHEMGVLRGVVDGRTVVAVGGLVDGDRPVHSAEVTALFGAGNQVEVVPLTGFALPYEDKTVDECRVLTPALQLPEQYRAAILREADRVAVKLGTADGDDRR